MSEARGPLAERWLHSEMSDLAKRTFFATMEASAAGTLATDRSGTIVWINERYCQLLGSDATHLIGRAVASVIPGTRLPDVLATGRPVMLDVMQHGGQEWLVSRFPVFDPTGVVIGAFGFVLNQPHNDSTVKRARVSASTDADRCLLDGVAAQRRALHVPSFVGSSARAERVRALVRTCARSDAAVLITGPTGSGKEVVAQMVHRASSRWAKNFVAVNVGAIPESLFEAEFFGTAPGAYTGADRAGRMGKLQLADGGTLLLDELGDMPQHAQVKLLRFLDTGEYEPLGSNRLRRADVRLIAATSVDLHEAVAQKRFRADLYYRLAVFPVAVPALSERREDIPELCSALIQQLDRRHRRFHTQVLPSAIAALQRQQWPGNVRELRNLLERCTLLAEGGPIDAELVEHLIDAPTAIGSPADLQRGASRSLGQSVEALEVREIGMALAACQGSATEAARRLGISRTTLYKKARHFGISVGDLTVQPG